MITKEDYENALKNTEAQLINAEVNIEALKFMVGHIEARIKELPDTDPMPDEVKEITKGGK